MSRVVVTGAAGFIGFFVSKRLLERGDEVVGVDCLTPYYDVALKDARLDRLRLNDGFTFEQVDLSDRRAASDLFARASGDAVLHLAAQPGARDSLRNPHAHVDANVMGFLNVLEACRHHPVRHLVFASSSSVYGGNTKVPFSTEDNVDRPLSLYAATKKASELMAYAYSHLFHIPSTGLRFFTVYGPWGRPDMAPMLFTKAIVAGQPIQLYNQGDMKRDFTYIDDVVEGVVRTLDRPPSARTPPYQIYNIGNSEPVELMRFIAILESLIGRKAEMRMLPMQPGDMRATNADVRELEDATGFRPQIGLEEGLRRTVSWYREYYRV